MKPDHTFELLVEALVFASPEPINEIQLAELIDGLSSEQVPSLIDNLNEAFEVQQHAFRIIKGAGGYRFTTQPEFGFWVKKLVHGSGRVRLSKASLETISLIAYRQPISRSEIESIRGVDVSGVLRMLIERKLITPQGKSDKYKRALLYVTTPNFLHHFGLNTLAELPSPNELISLEEKSNLLINDDIRNIEERHNTNITDNFPNL